jgi:hypothetical protein
VAYDVEALSLRCDDAWTVASMWHSAIREAYRWLLPHQYVRMVAGDGGATSTRPISDHIFDPTGQQSLADGANQIAEALHPWDQPWLRLSPRDDAPEEVGQQIEDAADGLTKVLSSLNSRSNFHTAAIASHQDFLVSTGFLLGERDPFDESRIRWQASPAWRWAIEADQGGRLVGLYRKLSPRARELPVLFPGGKFSSETNDLINGGEQERQTRVDMRWCCTWDPDGLYWQVCAYEVAEKHDVFSTQYRFCPVVCYRSSIVAGEPWGYGPGLGCLPDVKVGNRIVQLELQSAAIAVSGVWQAEDDGVLNPRSVKLTPGAIIPIAQGSKGLQPLQFPGRIDISQAKLDEIQNNVKRAFYVVKVKPEDAARMTATGYAGQKDQMIREMRGMYGQLRSEFAEPVMLRTLEIAERMGLVKEPLMERLTDVLLVGPLAQDVQGAEVQRVAKAIMAIEQAVGPGAGMAAVKLSELVPWVVAKTHAESKVFLSKPELEKLATQVATIASQMLAAQLAKSNPPPPAGQPTAGATGPVPPMLGRAA